MNYFFYPTGEAWCEGTETILEDHLEADGPEGVALWRLSLDLDTNTVIVKYDGMTEEEAEAQHTIDAAAAAAAAAAVIQDIIEGEVV